MIFYQETKQISQQQVLKLYSDANWTAYTKEPKQLFKAIENSLCVISAWEEDELVGLIRVVGDGHSIIYIQDIVVLKSHKKQKIGSSLVKKFSPTILMYGKPFC